MVSEIKQIAKSKKETRLEKKRLKASEKADAVAYKPVQDDSTVEKNKSKKDKNVPVKVKEPVQDNDSDAPEEYAVVVKTEKDEKKKSKKKSLEKGDDKASTNDEKFDFVEAGFSFAPVSSKDKKDKVEDDGLKIIEPKVNNKKLTVDDITAIDKEKEEKNKKRESLEQRSKYAVWVGNLRYITTDQQLRRFFSSCGTITRVNLPAVNGLNKGFAFVDFDSEDSLNKALALSEQEFEGRNLLIKDAKNYKKDGKKPPPKKAIPGESDLKAFPTLFIGNLPFSATKDKLDTLYNKFGEIKKVRISTFEDSGRCKGYAWIDFKTQEAATLALRSTQKLHIDGRLLKVTYAIESSVSRGFNLPQDHPNLQKRKAPQGTEDTASRISIEVNESNPKRVKFD